MSVRLPADGTVLFIGDSITDVGRDRDNPADLGKGYPLLVAQQLAESRPDVRVLNRGNGGNRSCDLRERWDADCIDLKPDVISVLVGINDTARCFRVDDPPTVADYEDDYRDILSRARAANADVQLVLLDPFLLASLPERLEWRGELEARIAVVHALAEEFGATLMRTDEIFAQAAGSDPKAWAEDGVHPTPPGHQLLADEWLKLVAG